ncbi:MAG: LysR family transcriptional regulator [Burkholderiaceae bacterium]|nr:LysR family transcriptional regulator [Burkholderiaceae bacterium]
MRYQRLDLNLINALRALLTEKNVTRAGELLCVSQSAMSGILARLREYFEDPLIVPLGRRMELTPLGESLVDKVNDLILMIDATLGTRPEFDPATTRRHFNIVASDYAVTVLLHEVLRDLALCAGGITIELRQAHRLSYQDLETGEVDFLIAPEWADTPGFSSALLFGDDYSGVVARDNPDVGDTLSLEQYLALGHVACLTNSGQPMFDLWFSRRHAAARRVEVAFPGFVMLPLLVLSTRRIATLHTRQAMLACQDESLRRVRLDFELPPFAEMLAWHKYRDHDPGSLWLRERIMAHARALAAPA